MIGNLLRTWFGNFEREELKKFIFIASIFAFTIGVYWMIRPLKDSAFMTIVGPDWIPWAKMLSLVVVVPLVIIYGKLVDMFPRHRVFYALCAIYGVLALLFAYLLASPVYGMLNPAKGPWRLTGWFWYVFVESFGSIMVALFWAFAADTTTPESAKRGYGIIAMGGQLGGIVGPLLVSRLVEKLGTSSLVGMSGAGIFLIALMVFIFMRSVSQDQLVGFQGKNTAAVEKKEAKVGFAEGLGLMLSQPYLLGIFAVISLYEVIVTIFDFQFKVLAGEAAKGDALSKFLGDYGAMTNALALLCLLLGVSNISRWLGLTVSLTLLPVIIGCAALILATKLNLTVAMLVMIFSKALNYALNQPAKEQLYIPTTRETKYKAKAWIEMFGSRGSKAMGSGINALKAPLGNYFLTFCTISSLGLVAIWFLIALFLGRTHKKAVDQNKVVC